MSWFEPWRGSHLLLEARVERGLGGVVTLDGGVGGDGGDQAVHGGEAVEEVLVDAVEEAAPEAGERCVRVCRCVCFPCML